MSNEINKKECSKCRKIKSFLEFYKNKAEKDGLEHYCKPCDLARMRRYAKTEKGKLAQKRAFKKYLLKKKAQKQ